jgi:hypothetical protein
MIWGLIFESNPCEYSELGNAFSESSYFTLEAISQQLEYVPATQILIARFRDAIVGAMTYTIESRWSELKVGMVEVLECMRWRQIWPWLLLKAEESLTWVHTTCFGYLNCRSNQASANMFLKAGYTRKDELKFYK